FLCCLTPLCFYKYSIFTENVYVNAYFLDPLILPLGLSFFTFQAISYIFDCYRKTIETPVKFKDFLLYIAFFPQLVAGPIVRANQLIPQLTSNITITKANCLIGFQLFLLGLFQKIVIADHLAIFVNGVFKEPDLFNSLTLWFGLLCFCAQVFSDFCAYTLMAIGLARIFGITLPENFNEPFFAANISDFWQRWHITLTTWLRDYVFMPLGGSRGRSWRSVAAILITLLIAGAWHSLHWTFLAWGLIQGIALIVHRIWRMHRRKFLSKAFLNSYIYSFGCWGLLVFFIVLSSLFSRAHSTDVFIKYWIGLWRNTGELYWFYPPAIVIFFAAIFIYAPLRIFFKKETFLPPYKNPVKKLPFAIILLMLLATFLFSPPEVEQFIYLRF
ncbi:MAG: hypothetical protein OXQ96_02150, partial [Alphaproteobacteria bacterium]|nr:hypothetical protein [Alphaproteobacteria bacterium]